MKTKIIQGVTDTSEYSKRFGAITLEIMVQEFLNENPQIKIQHVKQSSATSDNGKENGVVTIISIWYEEG